MNLSDRVLRPASRPVPVGAGFEVGLKDRLQHQLESGLNNNLWTAFRVLPGAA